MYDRQRMTINRQIPLLLLVIVFTPLYLAFLSASLDDFDSYSFVLALHQFSLDLYQPQPPGFPVYIALGRLMLHLVGNARLSLTLLSAISGVVVAIAIYGLSERRPLPGIAAALLVGFSPMGWLTAEKALSDAPGLAITLLAVWALWSGRDKSSRLILGGFITGLGLGLRPQNILPVLLLLLGLSVRHLWLRRPFRILGALIASTAAGVLFWLLPTLNAIGGLSAYWFHISKHAAHVRAADSVFGTPLTSLALQERWRVFAETFLSNTVGFTPFAQWNWLKILRGFVAVAILAGIFASDWRDPFTWILAGWVVIVASQIFLLEAVDRPRLFLPILPPLALLVARGWSRLQYALHWLPKVLLMGASFAMMQLTLPLAVELSKVPAPPTQATAYVAATYPSQTTVLAAAGSFRAAQVELPAYRIFYLYQFDSDAVSAALQAPTRYVVIFDREQFPENVIQTLTNNGQFVVIEERKCSRSALVHPQHAQVYLQVFTNLDRVPQDEMTISPGGCVDIGSREDWHYLRSGWYRAGYFEENIGGVSGRWAGQVPTATLQFVLPQPATLHLTMRAMAYPSGQEVSLYLNGKNMGHWEMSTFWETYALTIPAEGFLNGTANRLELVHKFLSIPFEQTGGTSLDKRLLAAAYDWICLDYP